MTNIVVGKAFLLFFFFFFKTEPKIPTVPLSEAKVITRKIDRGICGYFFHIRHSLSFLQRSQNYNLSSSDQNSREKGEKFS